MILISNFSNALTWETNYEIAQKTALATNRFILVDFWATWCGPCKKMDADSWSDAEVKQIMQDFVLLKVDIDINKELAMKYSVNSIPNMFVLDANGKKLTTFSGYQSASELKKILLKYALSTEFVSMDLINQYKYNTFPTALRLSQKYLDYSLYVDKGLKLDVLNLSTIYLDEAKSKISKKDLDYLEKLQRLELIKLYEYAYKFNYDKLIKKLDDNFVENNIYESNKSFYYFLKYIGLKGTNSVQLETLEKTLNASESLSSVITKCNKVLEKNI